MKRFTLLFTSMVVLACGPLFGTLADPVDTEEHLPAVEPQVADPEHHYTIRELEQLLAPIALYPDVLLAQVLIASTYPLEVVQARRWLEANPHLEGQAAVDAAEADQNWDPSVIALIAFPSVLKRLDENLNWTEELGNSFLLQEDDLLTAVQNLRQQADTAGNLDQQEHLIVQRMEKTILIEPADPTVIYVPYYSTRVIYGYTYWNTYQPVYWAPPPRHYYPGSGMIWVQTTPFVSPFFYASFYWPSRSVVVINRREQAHYGFRYSTYSPRYATYPRWQHDPRHRRGVVYPPAALSRHHTRISGSRTYLGHPDFTSHTRYRPPPPPTGRAIRPDRPPPADARFVRTRPGLPPSERPAPPRPGVRPGSERPPAVSPPGHQPPPRWRQSPPPPSPETRQDLSQRLRQTSPRERPAAARPSRPDWNPGRSAVRSPSEGFRAGAESARPTWQSQPPRGNRDNTAVRPPSAPNSGQRLQPPPQNRQHYRPAPANPPPPPPAVRNENREAPPSGRFSPRQRAERAPAAPPSGSRERSAPPPPRIPR